MPGPGFAVLDFETTGFSPRHHHRVVELAVVHVSPRGEITGRWETLINPERQIDAVHIHGIRSVDVMHAPRFRDIASRLLTLLEERVLVAHNARFDVDFLVAELIRAGLDLDAWKAPVLDTMQLAGEIIPGAGRSLADCCGAFDIEITQKHRAIGDALATAELLGSFISSTGASGWESALIAAQSASAPIHALTADTEWIARAENDAPHESFLARIAVKLPDEPGPEKERQYLAMLDMVLLDRQISAHEADQLVALAEHIGIGRDAAVRLHGRYFTAVVATAWADGVLTAEELADIAIVAKLLEIPAAEVSAALAPPVDADDQKTSGEASAGFFALEAGDAVVLTGDMWMPRDEIEARLRALGLEVKPGVSKKVRLVVAADPDSLSGKARKARDLNIAIVGEDWLRAYLQA